MIEFETTIDETTGEQVVLLPLTGLALLDTPIFNKGSAFPEDERIEFGLHGLLARAHRVDRGAARSPLWRLPGTAYRAPAAHLPPRPPGPQRGPLLPAGPRPHRRDDVADLHAGRRRGVPAFQPDLPQVARAVSVVRAPRRAGRDPGESTLSRDRCDRRRPTASASSAWATWGSAAWASRSASSRCTPFAAASILRGRCRSSWTSAPTTKEALADPLYLGWRHERVRGQAYDDFIEAFVQAVIRAFPNVLLQWEDFAKPNARRLLDHYRDRLCTFNDDIQGTAAVALAAILSALNVTGTHLRDQRIVIVGAGSAGIGISDQIATAMMAEGLSERDALTRLWLVGRHGLLHSAMTDLQPAQMHYAQPLERLQGWARDASGCLSLIEVVEQVKPTVLIGTTGQPGMFTEEVVRAMARHVERPAIFPLSNPTSRSEAIPRRPDFLDRRPRAGRHGKPVPSRSPTAAGRCGSPSATMFISSLASAWA